MENLFSAFGLPVRRVCGESRSAEADDQDLLKWNASTPLPAFCRRRMMQACNPKQATVLLYSKHISNL